MRRPIDITDFLTNLADKLEDRDPDALVREHEQTRGVHDGCRAGTGAGIGDLPRSRGRSSLGVHQRLADVPG